jgi:hypothetical protein
MNAHFVPAPGLAPASAFDGFESKARRVEVIVANIEAPFSVIEEGFNEASFKSGGMQMMSRGDFTVNGARGVLFKVLHPDGETKWGKWVMLVENGGGTLVVNAAFVSGDADAASDLERMLKGVYLEPAGATPIEAEAVPRQASGITAAEPGVPTASGDSALRAASRDASGSFDKKEALSIIARDITSSADVAPRDSVRAVSRDITSQDKTTVDDGVSGDRPARRSSVRIFTEDGIVASGDASITPEEADKTEKREPSEDADESNTSGDR